MNETISHRVRARWLGPAAGALLAFASSVPLRAETARADTLPTERSLPLALAAEAASAAVESCAKRGYRVSAAVVDRAGVVRALLRADGAGAHTVDGAIRKAYTAASYRMPTSFLVEYVKNTPAAEGLRFNDRVAILGGGVPIAVGDDVIGALAVGGAPGGERDDACAHAGVDKISDRLR